MVFFLNYILSNLGLPPIIPPIVVAECENDSSSEESDRPSCSTSTRTHRAERDFDLNQTPSPMEEEENDDLYNEKDSQRIERIIEKQKREQYAMDVSFMKETERKK